jgi:hypothetical protein
MKPYITLIAIAMIAMASPSYAGDPDPAEGLLPDIIVNPTYLEDAALVTNVEQGHYHLRFSNSTPNIGDGTLFVYGVPVGNEDAKGEGEFTQEVRQRIFFEDDTFVDRTAGLFTFHPSHNHVHMDSWAQYRLRAVTEGNGVGDVVAEGEKTSFCLLDSVIYDAKLPNAAEEAVFTSCEFGVQGISVGWQDVYNRFLPDQWIDVTDVPNGQYWLESTVDPLDNILEKDETNNVARILVTVDKGDIPIPGRPWYAVFYELFDDLLSLFTIIANIIQTFLSFGFGGR